MMKTIKQVVLGHGVATVAIMLSCSGQPENEMGQRGGPGGSDSKEAHAAPTGGSGGAVQPAMPKNAAHVSFRVLGAPNVQVGFASIHQYPLKITKEGDSTIVTVFLPQGTEIITTLSFMDEDGNPIGESVTYTIDSRGKLGTYNVQLGEVNKELGFDDSSEQVLQIGENILDVPSSEQFVGGSTSNVRQGVFTSESDMTYHVSWMGCQELRSFHDGPAECHDEPFDIALKAGEELGLYPVTSGDEPVSIAVESHGEEE